MQNTSDFDQLLQAAAAQPERQRLLFVFATADLPEDATPAQRQRYTAGGGGTLTPLMCVDKGTHELTSFAEFLAESHEAGPPWQIVFAAGLSGHNGQPPSTEQVERALEKMVERVRGGMIDSLLALDPSGEALQFV
ncbi:MAG: ribonucleotide reductase subunit alpha [Longimicrobiales bacterium]